MTVQGFEVDVRDAQVIALDLDPGTQMVTVVIAVPVEDVAVTFAATSTLVRREV